MWSSKWFCLGTAVSAGSGLLLTEVVFTPVCRPRSAGTRVTAPCPRPHVHTLTHPDIVVGPSGQGFSVSYPVELSLDHLTSIQPDIRTVCRSSFVTLTICRQKRTFLCPFSEHFQQLRSSLIWPMLTIRCVQSSEHG
jgi:hypothetical protein